MGKHDTSGNGRKDYDPKKVGPPKDDGGKHTDKGGGKK